LYRTCSGNGYVESVENYNRTGAEKQFGANATSSFVSGGELEQYGPNSADFTWRYDASEGYPWVLPDTTDYMYTSYAMGSFSNPSGTATGQSYQPSYGVYDVDSSDAFNSVMTCIDNPDWEDAQNRSCHHYFPGYQGQCTSLYEEEAPWSGSNCSASCGRCNRYVFDTDNGRTNTHDYSCALYTEMPLLCDIQDAYNDDDFIAGFHCAACGGGSSNVCLPGQRVETPSLDYAMVISLDISTNLLIVQEEMPRANGLYDGGGSGEVSLYPIDDLTKSGVTCNAADTAYWWAAGTWTLDTRKDDLLEALSSTQIG